MNDADFIRDSIKYLEKYSQYNVQKQAQKYGFTVPQIKIIKKIIKYKRITITQLCDQLDMSQSTISDIVNRLISKGVLVKYRDDNDKRSYVISASKEVDTFLEKDAFEFKNIGFEKILEHISQSDKEIALKGLEILVNAANIINHTLTEDLDI